MLGFMGTVIGMIEAFDKLPGQHDQRLHRGWRY